MNPKDNLEVRIRRQYDLICQLEEVEQLSSDPQERQRMRNAIEEQERSLRTNLAAYVRLCHAIHQSPDEKIHEAIILMGIDVATSLPPLTYTATDNSPTPSPAPDPLATHPAFDPQQTPDPQQRNELAMQLDREGKDDRNALDLLHRDYWAQRIEPGVFVMGDDESDRDNEKPAFPYTITQPYALARFPVTNRQYAWFLEELAAQGKTSEAAQRKPHHWKGPFSYPLGSGSHPVTNVDWTDACAFAAWADAKLHREGILKKGEQVRLPTEPEWERAAAYPCVLLAGRSASVRRRYPWGNTFDMNDIYANTKEASIGRPSVVGIFPHGAADCGAEDMAGNVWEWCSTPYQGYPLPAGLKAESIDTLSTEEYQNKLWVLRGGAWYSEHMFARCAFRTGYDWRRLRHFSYGVRLARLFSS